jgi:hypothetical protein
MTHIYPVSAGTVIMHWHRSYRVMAPNFLLICEKMGWLMAISGDIIFYCSSFSRIV